MRLKRTHTCGQLRKSDAGSTITLNGWVRNFRDHGDLTFIDLRDRYGLTQIIFNPARNPDIHAEAKKLRSEFVIGVVGEVCPRPEGTVNPDLETGEIEVYADDLELMAAADPIPLEVDEYTEATMEVRLKNRHLDLRRPGMQQNLIFRHRIFQAIRSHVNGLGFIDIETPMLTKSTPEGARDFLVPSRLSPGEFFALPQSPQLFKQVLMCSGYDRYYQIVRCFRDEDLRADRQPEFTQLDLEMSFVDEDDVIGVIDELMVAVMHEAGVEVKAPFPRLTYQEAIDTYGSDAPDMRFEMKVIELTDIAKNVDFRVFRGVADSGGQVRGLNAKASLDKIARRQLDKLTDYVKEFGAKGLAWMRIEENQVNAPIAKFFTEDELEQIKERMGAEPGDILFFVADSPDVVAQALKNLRLRLGQELGLIPDGEYHLSWVVDFPLLEKDEEEDRYVSLHHPFTSPKPEFIDNFEESPLEVKAQAYDIVLNGIEIGGGSIRIHNQDVQKRVFSLLGIGEEEAEMKFGFLLNALRHGCPPHGGIALGLDRIIMILRGQDSLREVIAFPKTQKGTCLFTNAPSPVDGKQLRELAITARPPAGD